MKNKLYTLFLFGIILFTFQSCTKDSIKIGNQEWMSKNLDVDKFRNGDIIPEAKSKEEWIQASDLKQPAWCYYNNDSANFGKYGKLYNWYAVNDERGLAPEGWHIPKYDEWTILIDYLGGENVAGHKMKSTSGWENNGNGTNESGFGGLPAPCRSSDGAFADVIGYSCCWWCYTEDGSSSSWYSSLSCKDSSVFRYDLKRNKLESGRGRGLYVRCIKDAVKPEEKNDGVQVNNKNQSGTKTYSREDFRNSFDDVTISQVYDLLGKPFTDYANSYGKERARAIYVYQNISYEDDPDELDEQVVIYFRSYQNVIQNGSWPRKIWQLRVSKIEFQKTAKQIDQNWN